MWIQAQWPDGAPTLLIAGRFSSLNLNGPRATMHKSRTTRYHRELLWILANRGWGITVHHVYLMCMMRSSSGELSRPQERRLQLRRHAARVLHPVALLAFNNLLQTPVGFMRSSTTSPVTHWPIPCFRVPRRPLWIPWRCLGIPRRCLAQLLLCSRAIHQKPLVMNHQG